MKFFARTEPWADSVDVVAVQDGDGGIRRFVRVTLEVADEIKPGNICAPSITLWGVGRSLSYLSPTKSC